MSCELRATSCLRGNEGFQIADWRFDGGTDLQLPIADLKSAITREALAEELNERWGV